MRVSNWRPSQYDGEFISASMERLKAAAEVVAESARQRCPVGKISRPVYKSGKYAGRVWTARTPGALKKTIRVVEKYQQFSAEVAQFRNVRVYAGNYITFYAKIVEYAGKAFMRPALNSNRAKIRNILEHGG